MTAIKDALIGARFLDKGGAVFNVRHPSFGGVGDGVADDGKAFNLARTAVPSTGGIVLVPPGTYLLTTAFTFASQTGVQLLLLPGVVLTGLALPTPTGTNTILDYRSGVLDYSGTIKTDIIREHSSGVGVSTPGDFDVAGALDLGGDLELASRDITFGSGNQHNVATGTVTVQRITPASSGNNVTGFAGGRAGRKLLIINLSTTVNDDLDLQHEDALSVAANRITVPNAVQVAVLPRGAIELWYDGSASRWRVLRPTT